MKKTSKLIALTLSLLLMLGLTACGSDLTADQATQCVQVELDATYKGDFEGFMEFYSNVSRDDAKEQYDYNIETEATYFLTYYGVSGIDGTDVVSPTEFQQIRARNLFQDIYAKSDYTIISAAKQSDGSFSVKLSIRPLNIIELLEENYETYFTDFYAKYENVDVESMSDVEFENWYVDSYARDYYTALLDALEAQVPDIGYSESQELVIQVLMDEDGLSFGDGDWAKVDNLIIDYNF